MLHTQKSETCIKSEKSQEKLPIQWLFGNCEDELVIPYDQLDEIVYPQKTGDPTLIDRIRELLNIDDHVEGDAEQNADTKDAVLLADGSSNASDAVVDQVGSSGAGFSGGGAIGLAPLALVGGGGGGGGGSSTIVAPPVAVNTNVPTLPVSAFTVQGTSYENFKQTVLGTTALRYPDGERYNWVARTYADFNGDGKLDAFVAQLNYHPDTSTADTAPSSSFRFYLGTGSGYVENTLMLTNPQDADSIHPRKAIVADFNGDSRPDIFVANTGYDGANFPGERSKVILSNPDGTYTIKNASRDISYAHGATALDVDRDGDIDVIVVDNMYSGSSPGYTLLNDGRGNFTRDSVNRFPSASNDDANYYTVEAVDVNRDGHPDLLLGGHEFDGAETYLALNNGSGKFSQATKIPEVEDWGTVLDFLVTTDDSGNKDVFILRTGDNYQGVAVQKWEPDTGTSSLPYANSSEAWIPWIVGNGTVIGTDTVIDHLSFQIA